MRRIAPGPRTQLARKQIDLVPLSGQGPAKTRNAQGRYARIIWMRRIHEKKTPHWELTVRTAIIPLSFDFFSQESSASG